MAALLCYAVVFSGCLSEPATTGGPVNLTLYGFSIMKETMEKAVCPGFAAKWKREHGQEVRFAFSFAGSETVVNQILQGVVAQVAILSTEKDAQRLMEGKAVTSDWRLAPHQGIVNRTPIVILTRPGNPRRIRGFGDLAQSGLKLIHPDPVSSGGALWSLLAIYGSALRQTEQESGHRDEIRALEKLKATWRNVISSPGSAREARTQFEAGFGDALVTYELEGLLMQEAAIPVEIVTPESTIISEHPVVVIDRCVTTAQRPVINSFIEYLWSDEAQRAFVHFHFRPVSDQILRETESSFVQVKEPFTVDYFGGWQPAYSDVVEHVWRDQVQRAR